MKLESMPEPEDRDDSVVYARTPHGIVARQKTRPRNPRTAAQQKHRNNVRVVSARWGSLPPEQRAAWRTTAASRQFVNDAGIAVRLSGYNFFVSLNTRRADLALPQFDLPPAAPVFSPNPVVELVLSSLGGRTTVKLRVSSLPACDIVVQAAAPTRTGVRRVQRFPVLGLLPPPVDGWSDITELYVARYGVPQPGTAVWIRTCQHIDGYADMPKVLRARVPAAP